ncbi:FprA family A-type flavoprotein [Candidatus Fermentibacteria bacterium]|nr:FprA family A-type flavoprotein [Candidatus Fermentibacteria bacterium]
MSTAFRAMQIGERTFWVGAIDWGLRDFHGYATSRGSTYNAYLVLGDKVTLIDTVKAPFRDELLSRIRSVIDPSRIDYIVSNHAEMDHSGSLPYIIEAVKPERVFASPMGVTALNSHFDLGEQLTALKDGETLSLGNMSLAVLETRMLHWPDSMMTFLPDEGILFSQDGFGMHLATSRLFADEIDPWVVEHEGIKYYANILMPLSRIVEKALDRVRQTGWSIRIIAPDHGPVWRQDVGTVMGWYQKWAAQKPTMKAVVFFDTMWNSTALMARAIAEGLTGGGALPKVMPLSGSHRSDVATALLDAGALIVGTPTINSNMFPTVSDTLTYLKGLKPANKIGAAFGSFGWSGEAAGHVETILKDMGVEISEPPFRVKYVPGPEELARCREFGGRLAASLKEHAGA